MYHYFIILLKLEFRTIHINEENKIPISVLFRHNKHNVFHKQFLSQNLNQKTNKLVRIKKFERMHQKKNVTTQNQHQSEKMDLESSKQISITLEYNRKSTPFNSN